MGSLRAIVGFVTFLLAFALRGGSDVPPSGTALGTTVGRTVSDMTVTAGDLAPSGPPAWNFGVVIAASIGGGLLGAAVGSVRPAAHPGGDGAPGGHGRGRRRRPRRSVVRRACSGQTLLSFCVGGLGLGREAGVRRGRAARRAGCQPWPVVRPVRVPVPGRVGARRRSSRWSSRIPTDVGGAMVMALAVAAGVFFAIGMQAVRRGDAPPKLPTARGVSRQIRTRAAERRSRTVTRRPGDVARQRRERPSPGPRRTSPTVSPRREDRGNPGPRTSRRRA